MAPAPNANEATPGGSSRRTGWRRSTWVKALVGGCFSVAVISALLLGGLVWTAFHITSDRNGRLRYCDQVVVGFWDDFYPDGTWKDGGQAVWCDDELMSKTHALSECADLGLPEGCDPTAWP